MDRHRLIRASGALLVGACAVTVRAATAVPAPAGMAEASTQHPLFTTVGPDYNPVVTPNG